YERRCRICQQACPTNVMHSAFRIFEQARRLLRQRRIQESRLLPTSAGRQDLIWLDGEALCVTPEFHGELNGCVPEWLRLAALPALPRNLELRTCVGLPADRQAVLVRRRQIRIFGGWWNWLRRKRPASPELRQAALLLRLQ